MPGLHTTRIIHGTDYRWLGSNHHRPARSGVLDLAAFAAHVKGGGVLYGQPSAGYVPSGTPVTKQGDRYVPYEVGASFDGVLLRDISVGDAGGDPMITAAILDDGRLIGKYVPTADGEPFVTPDKTDNNTSIIFA